MRTKGTVDSSATLPYEVVQFPLVIGDTGRHFLLKFLHRQDFDPDINYVANEKGHVLYKEVVRNERVLSELHLNRHSLFYKVSLVIGEDRFQSCGFNFGLLLRCGQVHGLADQLGIGGDPIGSSLFTPAVSLECIA